ncbi:Prefoldin subunit-domain-containing protein [Balamuthia mandrillaris]
MTIEEVEEEAEGPAIDWEAETLKAERHEKVKEYTQFIKERLEVDLHRLLAQRNKIQQQRAQYLQLGDNLRLIKDNNLKELKTMTNLGSDFFVQTRVPDCSKVCVNVGLGFHVEYTLDEALAFIDAREKDLNEEAQALTRRCDAINERIRLMYQGIAQLLELDEEAARG